MVRDLVEPFLAFAAIWMATAYLWDANRKLDPWLKIIMPKLRKVPQRRKTNLVLTPAYAFAATLALVILIALIMTVSQTPPTVVPVNVGRPTPYATMNRDFIVIPTALPTNTPKPLPTETPVNQADIKLNMTTPTATATLQLTVVLSPTVEPTPIIAIVATPTAERPATNPVGDSSSSIVSSSPVQPSSVVSSIQSSSSSVASQSSSSVNSVILSSASSSAANSSSVVAPPSSSAISIQSSFSSSKNSKTQSGLTLPGTNAPLSPSSFLPFLIVLGVIALLSLGLKI